MDTTNMELLLSTPLVTTGPLWANNVEANWLLLDTHDHSPGKGVPITPAGLNINTDLDLAGFSILNLLTSSYSSQGSSLAATFQSCVYVVGGDLYFNNGTGVAVQVTSGTSVNVSGVGGITGLAGTTAALTYNNTSKLFIFTQNAGITAGIDAGPVTVRENVAAAQGITIQSPSGLGGSYSLTLFTAPPGSTLPVLLSGAGVLSTGQITTAQIGANQVTGNEIAPNVALSGNVTASGSFTAAAGNITATAGSLSASAGVFPGAASKAKLTAPDTNALAQTKFGGNTYKLPICEGPSTADSGTVRIIRGVINGVAGTIVNGNGFSITKLGTGNYRITYTEAFSVSASPVANGIGSGDPRLMVITNHDATKVEFRSYRTTDSVVVDTDFVFAVFGITV